MDRALIIKQPWINLILDNGKSWEMRTTKTKIRGRIGLIEQGTGMIIGEADLYDCSNYPIPLWIAKIESEKHQVDDLNLLRKWCYVWYLKDIKRYDKPIPYKHPQGAVIWVKI